MKSAAVAAVAALVLAACAHLGDPAPSLAPGARYVAMGSSFAAGPGVTQSADTPANSCSRSTDNYARQLARKRNLALTDVGCSGATTATVLGVSRDLPPQIEAVTADTALVTITIGGNDIGYATRLNAVSCNFLALPPPARTCGAVTWPTEAQFERARAGMAQIAAQVRARAPKARLVFVDYLTILAPKGVCADTPMSAADAEHLRRDADRLAAITAEVAKAAGAEVIRASDLSRDHSACAAQPWINGYPRPGGPPVAVAYHPRLEGMTAIAEALDRQLER